MKSNAYQLQNAIQSGKRLALIDVRTPVEHEETRIAGSVLMPLDKLDSQLVKKAAAGAESCVLICQGGKRAEQAYEKLRTAGCEGLSILEGGVNAWAAAGLPLERSTKKHLPLMRQVQLTIGLITLIGSLVALTVNKNFAIVPALLGAGMTMAGVTGWCGLAVLISKMPWNKQGTTCAP
jgi:rhodanese-related sulfurtransferase